MCRGIGIAAREQGGGREGERGTIAYITLRSSGHAADVGIERSATNALGVRWAAGHPQKVARKVRTRTFVRLGPSERRLRPCPIEWSFCRTAWLGRG